VLLGVLDLEATERSTVFGECDLALELDTKCLQAVEIDLLASSDVDVFGRCIACEGVAMKCRYTVGIAGCWVFLEYVFPQSWGICAAVTVCKFQGMEDGIVQENI